MAWNAIDPAVPGEVISAAWFNEQVGDNLTWLRTHGPSLPGQTANDFIYAASADTLARQARIESHGPYFRDGAWGQWPLVWRGAAFAPWAFLVGSSPDSILGIVPTANSVPFYSAASGVTPMQAVGTHEMYLPASAFRPRVFATPMAWHQVYTNAQGGEFVGMPTVYTAGVQDAVCVVAMPKAWNEATTIGVSVLYSHAYATGASGWFASWNVWVGHAGHGEILAPATNVWTPAQVGIEGAYVLAVSGVAQLPMPPNPGPNKLTYFIVRRQYGGGAGDSFGDNIFVGLKLYLQTDKLTDD